MAGTTTASADEVIAAVLEDLTEPGLVVTPSPAVTAGLIEAASDLEMPSLQLLASDAALKDATADFLVASRAADLIEDSRLALRAAPATPETQLVVTDTDVTALVSAGDTMAALPTEEADFVEAANDYYTEAWNQADEFSLRTPPLSQVHETLRETFGPEFQEDFATVLASQNRISGEDGLNIVQVFLLLTAKHGELLYDISKWGEDIGVASKATFSRNKTQLEDHGLIGTEKVPIDVGRPRLRLFLADERLRDASADELADAAEQLIG